MIKRERGRKREREREREREGEENCAKVKFARDSGATSSGSIPPAEKRDDEDEILVNSLTERGVRQW
jgi:hypothetical protein